MIENVVAKINTAVGQKLTDYNVFIHGIAEPITIRNDEDEDVITPAVIDEKGECHTVFIDDNYRFGCYHRVLSKVYTTDIKKGYGDTPKVAESYNMLLVCWAFNANALKLERAIYAAMSNEITVVSVDFDKKRVFSNEISGVKFFVVPENSLFAIKYKVQLRVKACIDEENIFNK